jgi:putative membrane protein
VPFFEFLLPYEFSPTVLVACAFAVFAYVRGMRRISEPVGFWRSTAFLLGVGLSYVVLQTHYDYMAQHMFFMHRIQHLVLHHLAPFLITLSLPQAVLREGLPESLGRRVVQPLWHSRPVAVAYRILQQPVIAAVLFVGLIGLWLIPRVHFYAMLNADLYKAMNWSMLLDGLLFWWLMLNPRPKAGPATLAFGWRITILFLVMWPQIFMGAYISLSERELYDIYAVCGRLWPVSPLVDQEIGGLVTWIPAAMMSVIGILVVLRLWIRWDRAHQKALAEKRDPARPMIEL